MSLWCPKILRKCRRSLKHYIWKKNQTKNIYHIHFSSYTSLWIVFLGLGRMYSVSSVSLRGIPTLPSSTSTSSSWDTPRCSELAIVSPMCPRSTLVPLPGWACLKHLPREMLYPHLLISTTQTPCRWPNFSPYPEGVPSHPVNKTLIGHLYLRPSSFSHNTHDCWWELWGLTRKSRTLSCSSAPS